MKVYVSNKIQSDGSVKFSKTREPDTAPYPATRPATLNLDAVPADWHWPYTTEDLSSGWVPAAAIEEN